MGVVTETLLDDLYDAGVVFEDGLTDDELRDVERRLGIAFGADHRDLLSRVLPVGRGWPDWLADDDELRTLLAAPVERVVSDALDDGFWPASWGTARGDEAVARAHLARVPVLVPVFGHRYQAAGAAAGAPVLSAYGRDVIYYGADLADYLGREFLGTVSPVPPVDGDRRVPFWSDLADGTDPIHM